MNSWVYPRVCGEPSVPDAQHVLYRVYPRVCGEPLLEGRPRGVVSVYPRVCGGTLSRMSEEDIKGGLSPRVRGNLMNLRPYQQEDGSIPACAGEPAAIRPVTYTGWVYPRVCGGTGSGSFSGLRTVRSIPACAGEPQVSALPSSLSEVYPRVCGGTSWNGTDYTGLGRSIPRVCGGTCLKRWCKSVIKGLSPRVRGNPMCSTDSVNL